jgi:excisionase family DNA binding protein
MENEHTMKLVDAAQLLGVHFDTVRRWVRVKGLPARKPGRDWMFSRREVLEWQNRQRPGMQAAAPAPSAPASTSTSTMATVAE